MNDMANLIALAPHTPAALGSCHSMQHGFAELEGRRCGAGSKQNRIRTSGAEDTVLRQRHRVHLTGHGLVGGIMPGCASVFRGQGNRPAWNRSTARSARGVPGCALVRFPRGRPEQFGMPCQTETALTRRGASRADRNGCPSMNW